MQINSKIIDDLCHDAGIDCENQAREYPDNMIKIISYDYEDNNNFEVKADILENHCCHTYISAERGEIEDISCTCEEYKKHYGVCKHSLASILYFSKWMEKIKMMDTEKKEETLLQPVQVKEKQETQVSSNKTSLNSKYTNFQQMVHSFYQQEIESIDLGETIQKEGQIQIIPKIFYDKFSGDLKVEFKIGNKRFYKIKNLSEFYTRMVEKEFYRYGEKLQFIHTKEAFSEESQKTLDFLMKYAEIIKYANSNSNSNYRYYGNALAETSILLSHSGIDELFTLLKDNRVEFQRDLSTEMVEFVDKDPEIQFILEKNKEKEYRIYPNIEVFKVILLKGKERYYALQGNQFFRCSKEFEKTTLKLLETFRRNYLSEVLLSEEDLDSFFSIIKPKVKDAIYIKGIEEKIIEKYKPKELGVKVFLDFDESDYMIAEVKFYYDEEEFNPLNEKTKLQIPRNKIQETKALNAFRKSGFMLDVKNLRFILPDSEKIYQFLTQDIDYYRQHFEVMVTDNFKTKQIVKPKLGSLGVKVENDLLSLDFSQLAIDSSEIEDIMTKYKLKKKYHRLKNGVFLDLQENEELEFLDKLVSGMGIEYQDLQKEEIKIPVARTLYLNQLLKGIKGTEIIKNQEYKRIVQGLEKEAMEEIEIPSSLKATLRFYQKTGFQWLEGLDKYHFGGILADDMGLRKNSTNSSCFVRGKTKGREFKNKYCCFT